MEFNADNVAVRLGLTESQYEEFLDAKAALGFRTISLALSGQPSAPRYTGVMARLAVPFRGRSVLRLKRQALLDTVTSMRRDHGLHPYILSATGAAGDAVYAASFREMAAQPHVETLLSANAYKDENAKQLEQGRILLWMASFGLPNDLRFCAIWVPNTARVAWSAEAVNDQGETRQQRFDAMTSMWARPMRVAVTPAGGVARLFVDDRIGRWDAKSGQDRQGLLDEIEAQATAQRHPVCIGASGIGAATRYSTIFARRDDVLPRQWRVRGELMPGLSAAERQRVQAIDDRVQDFMRNYQLRGAALAIVKGTRLVHARGYTLAEAAPHYPDIEPTTIFRIGSVAKTLCALAAWRALANDPQVSRNSTMQSVLNLKMPGNLTPMDIRFPDITIRHLLESASGIDQYAVRAVLAAARAEDENGTPQPLSLATVASRVAGKMMLHDPGSYTDYGRTDYVLLGMVATKLSGKGSFQAALKQLVLDPLHMTRTRPSVSLIEQQPVDEARYHLAPLATDRSAMHNDRRLLPLTYGVDNMAVFSSAGGMSAAVVDLARIGAMMACRIGNPLFSTSLLDEWLDDAVTATATAPNGGKRTGFHGFDSASYDDVTTHRVNVEKGGLLPGARAGIQGITGEFFVAVAYNGEPMKETGISIDIKQDTLALARLVNWGSGDLFPQFGMPKLGWSVSGPGGLAQR